MERRLYAASNSIAHGGAAAAGAVSGASKRKGKGGVRGGGKKPIKVVYIGNPMRVTTSAAGFRALVQELTGRHADPSKYSGGGSAAIDAGDDDSSGAGSLQPDALPSPGGSTEVSSYAVAAAAAGHVAAPAWEYDDDDDSFPTQLIDNSYSMFSPPTFLYGPHSDM